MVVYTIGFTQKRASRFFELLAQNNVKTVLDVRLNNKSQLSGFARQEDLAYFLWNLKGIGYAHENLLAPPKDLLSRYRKNQLGWDEYADAFNKVLETRDVARRIDPAAISDGCLLCSEHQPHYCHRRLVLEHLQARWGISMDVRHLT